MKIGKVIVPWLKKEDDWLEVPQGVIVASRVVLLFGLVAVLYKCHQKGCDLATTLLFVFVIPLVLSIIPVCLWSAWRLFRDYN